MSPKLIRLGEKEWIDTACELNGGTGAIQTFIEISLISARICEVRKINWSATYT